MNKESVLIMGVGNILLGDEGIGIHFIEYMKKKDLPKNVFLLDGGTGGFHLLHLMHEYSKMIIIDATIDNYPIGHIRVLKPKYSKDYPKTLTTHDIGLKDLIETALVLEKLPEIYLIAITINTDQTFGLKLSDEMLIKLPEIKIKVNEVIKRFQVNVDSDF